MMINSIKCPDVRMYTTSLAVSQYVPSELFQHHLHVCATSHHKDLQVLVSEIHCQPDVGYRQTAALFP